MYLSQVRDGDFGPGLSVVRIRLERRFDRVVVDGLAEDTVDYFSLQSQGKSYGGIVLALLSDLSPLSPESPKTEAQRSLSASRSTEYMRSDDDPQTRGCLRCSNRPHFEDMPE
jgi:hypothetical protein